MAERKVQIRPDLLLAKAIQQKLQPGKKKVLLKKEEEN